MRHSQCTQLLESENVKCQSYEFQCLECFIRVILKLNAFTGIECILYMYHLITDIIDEITVD